ncbi:MAG: methionine adenosyltransferase [Candidatus Bathyarchaeia archaeon]
MDSVSIRLSFEYIKRYGQILHHNVDKGLLAAGEAENRFGGGSIKKPMKLIFGDRATWSVEEDIIPVDKIAISAAKEWFKRNMRFVDPDIHVVYQVEIKPGSQALRDIFSRGGRYLEANDTSAAVGYAPMSRVERVVYDVERFLNSLEFKRRYPETGEDIKVMGLRYEDKLDLTVSMAFVDKFIDCESTYFRRKEEVLEELKELLSSKGYFDRFEVRLNTLDRMGRGIEGLYLTVLGTSADSADSGQVGRGNRVNGVIPLNRPISSEAAAGKNPVSHIGKIYNVLTHKIADKIYASLSGLQEVYVWLLSQIGEPINEPKIAAVQLITDEELDIRELEGDVKDCVARELENIDRFCIELAEGKYPIV